MVGPFFYVDSDELGYHGWVKHLLSEDHAKKYGDFLTSPVGHAELFDMKFKDLKDSIEYFNFPRGRVVYNTVTESHIIYIDNCIKENLDNIMFSYHLSKYEVQGDEHYVCAKCSENFIE